MPIQSIKSIKSTLLSPSFYSEPKIFLIIIIGLLLLIIMGQFLKQLGQVK